MAASSASRFNIIEDRLLYLEKKDEANSREILRLKNDNLDLQSSVADLKRDNSKLSKQSNSATKHLREFKAETKDTIDHLTKEVVILRGLQKTLSFLTVKVAESGLEAKVTALQGKVNKLDERVTETVDEVKTVKVNSSSDRLQAMEVKVKKNKDNIRIVDDGLKTATKEIEDRTTSSFVASIDTTKALVARQWTRMDRCDGVDTRVTCFHQQGCELVSPLKGLYGAGAMMLQKGSGRMKVGLRWNGDLLSQGQTNGHGDECHVFVVCGLAKGDKLTVDVMREEGDAEVHDCTFFTFLINPL